MPDQKIKEIIFMLKQFLFRRGAMKIYKSLKGNQNKSIEDINTLNFSKRVDIIKYAYNNVPFYKELYDSRNFHPESVTKPEDWNNVPLITKEMIMNNNNIFISKNINNKHLKKSSTGGSTGHPLTVYHDKRFPLESIGWRLLDWWEVKKGNNMAFALRYTKKNKITKLINNLIWFPTRRIWLDAKKMSEEDIRLFVERFNKIKPTILQGYVGAIYHLAEFVRNNNLPIYSPEVVWVTSAPINEVQRNLIEKVFESKVYDQYGCGEVFWLAAECKENSGLHVFSDVRHIEYIDKNYTEVEDGMYGDALITDLENYAFPIIRYKNGDRGRFLTKRCECGLPFKVIDSVKGRSTDMIKSINGDVVAGDYITTIFDDYPEVVKGFQVHQKDDFSIDFIVIPNPVQTNYNEIIELVFNEFKNKFDNKQQISLKYVDEIAHDGGKTRYVLSEIN